MTNKTTAEIAEECALAMVKSHGQEHEIAQGDKSPGLDTLAWCLGGPIDYEAGMLEFAQRVVDADRAQRAEPLEIATESGSVIMFGEPTATREMVAEAFSAWQNAGADDEAAEGETSEELGFAYEDVLANYAGVTFK